MMTFFRQYSDRSVRLLILMRFTDAVVISGYEHRYRVNAVNAVDVKPKPVPDIATKQEYLSRTTGHRMIEE